MSQPWVPAAARALLLADAVFFSTCGGRLSTRSPGDITVPFALLQVPGNQALSADGIAFSPLVQVEGRCAPGGAEDPEIVAWRIAAEAARVLGRARNITYESMRYSGRLLDGPLADVDTSRGDAVPVYRAIVRAELIAHTT